MSNMIKIAANVLKTEANELTRNAEILDGEFEKAVEVLYKTKGKVVVTGVGKSGHVGERRPWQRFLRLSAPGKPLFCYGFDSS